MSQPPNYLEKFFGVIARGQTYLNLFYLLLAFPLGLFYFIFLVVGLSLGLSLLIVWVGILILAMVVAGWWLLAAFERQLAIWLLHEDIPPMTLTQPAGPRAWDKVVAYLSNPVTWKGLLYLFAKFPLGILSFVLLVTLGSVSITLISAPLLYRFVPVEVWFNWESSWQVDSMSKAAILFVVGAALLLVSLHLLNGLAWISGRFARVMLGNPVASAPQAHAAPVNEAEQHPQAEIVPEVEAQPAQEAAPIIASDEENQAPSPNTEA